VSSDENSFNGGYDPERLDIARLVDRLVTNAVGLAGVDAAGVILAQERGQPRSTPRAAGSDRRTMLIQQFQLDTREGPAVRCHREGTAVVLPELGAAGPGWERFAEAARMAGFAGVHTIPMRGHQTTIGALSLFGVRAGRLDQATADLAQLLADVVTLAILQHHTIRDARERTQQLQRALTSRVVIEQAKGVLSQRYGVDTDAAFTLLRNHARAHNMRLSTLADAVVHRVDGLPPPIEDPSRPQISRATSDPPEHGLDPPPR
jgi:ANTAR domain/GAF domain